MARLWLAVGVVLVLLAAAPSSASAGDTWCDVDPLVVVTTPKGNRVPIYVTTSALGVQHAPSLVVQAMAYSARPTNGGTATYVGLVVTVPNDTFGSGYLTRTKASSGPLGTGKLHGTAEGRAGSGMFMSFILPVP